MELLSKLRWRLICGVRVFVDFAEFLRAFCWWREDLCYGEIMVYGWFINTNSMAEELPTRWEVELEFVQALANIQYLNFLAQNKYLENEEFLAYLKYLEYWRKPEYAKHLVYPNCLHVLTLLQSEQFRQQILRQDAAAVLMNDMVHRWKEPQTTFAPTPIQNLVKEQNGDAEHAVPVDEGTMVDETATQVNGNCTAEITNGNAVSTVTSTDTPFS